MKSNPWMDRFEAVDRKFREENRAHLIAKASTPEEKAKKKIGIIVYVENSRSPEHYAIYQAIFQSPFKNAFPGQFYSLEEAKRICEEYNYNVKATVHEWELVANAKRLRRKVFEDFI